MAKKKAAAKASTTKRRSTAKKAKRRSSRRAGASGFQATAMEVLKGVAGAVLVAKFGDAIPIENPKARHAAVTAIGIYLASKPGAMKSVGIGAAIAGGTMLAQDVMPDLLTPSALGTGTTTVGRVSPALMQRMQAAAAQMRQGINGTRGRTIMGNGSGGDFPQPVTGARGRTIMGSGEPSLSY